MKRGSSRLHHLRSSLAALFIALVMGFVLLFTGCAKQGAGREPLGVNDAWSKAKNLYARERYLRAQEILRDIVLNYSGTSIIDSAQFYLGMTSFQLEDYLVAADHFHKLVEQYPSSTLGGDAVYYEARCYYEQAPSYKLDQTLTTKALQGFQRFLEDYIGHALTDSGYKYLGLCREKLAHKEYAASALYYDLGEYASGILYADVVLSNYYDTSFAGPAQFIKGRCYFALKDWDRARHELQTYLDKNPSGRFVLRARQLLSLAANRTGGAVSSGK
jgi:outer membrane protein assembly factor BamD